MPRIVCSAATTGASVQSGSIASICAVSRSRRASAASTAANVILEHDMMHRLLELEPRQPAAMQLGPSRPPVMAALPQQEPRELLACPAQRMHRIETRAHQIAHRLVPGIRNPHRRQLAGPVQPRQTGRIPPIGLDPVARPLRDQRRRHHDAFVPAASTSDVGCHTRTAPLRSRTAASRRRRRACAADGPTPSACSRSGRTPAPRRAGHPPPPQRRCFLVNIKPNVSDTIRHDPSPMHEARHRPIRRNPRYLHTVRRVAPSSGGHVV